jgi:Xaa-Pro aminopeptidase
MLDAYPTVIAGVRDAMRPGVTGADLDGLAGTVLGDRGLGDHQVDGIGHGLGLRFEGTPASTIIPPHRDIPLGKRMTAVGRGTTRLPIPGDQPGRVRLPGCVVRSGTP